MPQNVANAAQNVINVKTDGEIAYIGLNRPEKRNAINSEVLRALPEVLAEMDRPEIRAIILYGEGAVFSAGDRLYFARFRHRRARRRGRRS